MEESETAKGRTRTIGDSSCVLGEVTAEIGKPLSYLGKQLHVGKRFREACIIIRRMLLLYARVR